ncbi:MAG: polymerase sigma-70 factor, subfamily [Acidobacteriota bacterium]|jgi:RNA polymerase sigma-70 factor (ECF subfamily)|nr:polymerase sigma-70 factor, subfamily [Acidobacteriota bacterium]
MNDVGTAGTLLILSAGSGTATAVGPATKMSADAPLVEAVLGGDRDAFAQLYDLYGPMIHGILLARVPFDDVDDLVQDVFLAAFRRLHTLREAGAFGGWLAMIARNRAVDFHRRKHETEELPEDIPQRSSVDPEASEALALIRTLPNAYRETLVLRLVEGMTGPEIAERTGLTAASVRVNLHRGMKLLREKMGLEAS